MDANNFLFLSFWRGWIIKIVSVLFGIRDPSPWSWGPKSLVSARSHKSLLVPCIKCLCSIDSQESDSTALAWCKNLCSSFMRLTRWLSGAIIVGRVDASAGRKYKAICFLLSSRFLALFFCVHSSMTCTLCSDRKCSLGDDWVTPAGLERLRGSHVFDVFSNYIFLMSMPDYFCKAKAASFLFLKGYNAAGDCSTLTRFIAAEWIESFFLVVDIWLHEDRNEPF